MRILVLGCKDYPAFTTPSVHCGGMEVYAERNPADLHVVKVTEANLTFVAIDGNGQPRLIPKA